MKKLRLLAVAFIVATAFVRCSDNDKWIDDSPIIQFQDAKFLEALLSASCDGIGVHLIDKNGDGLISEKEAQSTTNLNLAYKEIRYMDEIRYFIALEYFQCQGNQLTTLNLSRNTTLTHLFCDRNQLTKLNINSLTNLTELDCSQNQLTSLDLSKNIALTWLGCNTNQLRSLKLSYNHILPEVFIDDIIKTYGNIITYTD